MEIEKINHDGTFIENLDPESIIDPEKISSTNMNDIYNYISSNYNYAFFIDGLITNLTNKQDIEVSATYINKKYNEINKFPLYEGNDLSFADTIEEDTEIPILVGFGLSKEYPLGTHLKIYDPALERNINIKVVGIMKPNVSHSNYYALDSKQYYNFSIVIPVNDSYINQANTAFKLNGLMDLILTETNEQKISSLKKYIHNKINVSFNYYSQQENIDFYNEYFYSSMKFIVYITGALVAIITLLLLWSSISSARAMIRDFTINLLVGLSYKKLRNLLYLYHIGVSTITLVAIFLSTAYSRQNFWINKESSFVTYGFLGLIEMDWTGIFTVFIFNIFITIITVNIILRKIQKIPISVGVIE
ncbi:hypothetical protein ACN081_08170 [Rothia sp. P13129]|uniref:hypothetical protein n=1 Tax=Rothia sp. P13129 TaxID=3402664 RepID=UPI003ACA2112